MGGIVIIRTEKVKKIQDIFIENNALRTDWGGHNPAPDTVASWLTRGTSHNIVASR